MEKDSSGRLYARVDIDFWVTERHGYEFKHLLNTGLYAAKVREAGAWRGVILGY